MNTRDAFEKWHKEHSGISLMKHKDGSYVYAESEWQSFLAGSASMQERAASQCNPVNAEILLHAGEMSPQELRSVHSVLLWKMRSIRAMEDDSGND